ncbi:MAG: hypothetical protein O3B95_04635 [Chloroflexi bacterium]|nr:hypothetical protein [Chloroflexota bacterium]
MPKQKSASTAAISNSAVHVEGGSVETTWREALAMSDLSSRDRVKSHRRLAEAHAAKARAEAEAITVTKNYCKQLRSQADHYLLRAENTLAEAERIRLSTEARAQAMNEEIEFRLADAESKNRSARAYAEKLEGSAQSTALALMIQTREGAQELVSRMRKESAADIRKVLDEIDAARATLEEELETQRMLTDASRATAFSAGLHAELTKVEPLKFTTTVEKKQPSVRKAKSARKSDKKSPAKRIRNTGSVVKAKKAARTTGSSNSHINVPVATEMKLNNSPVVAKAQGQLTNASSLTTGATATRAMQVANTPAIAEKPTTTIAVAKAPVVNSLSVKKKSAKKAKTTKVQAKSSIVMKSTRAAVTPKPVIAKKQPGSIAIATAKAQVKTAVARKNATATSARKSAIAVRKSVARPAADGKAQAKPAVTQTVVKVATTRKPVAATVRSAARVAKATKTKAKPVTVKKTARIVGTRKSVVTAAKSAAAAKTLAKPVAAVSGSTGTPAKAKGKTRPSTISAKKSVTRASQPSLTQKVKVSHTKKSARKAA